MSTPVRISKRLWCDLKTGRVVPIIESESGFKIGFESKIESFDSIFKTEIEAAKFYFESKSKTKGK